MNCFDEAMRVLTDQFGKDVAVSLATESEGRPSVRVVNAFFRDGAFYVMTCLSSGKMRELLKNPNAAVCRGLFSARGTGTNLGGPLLFGNADLASELRKVFRAFYDRHVDEADPDTCILRIELTDCVAFTGSAKYIVDFKAKTSEKRPFVNDIIE